MKLIDLYIDEVGKHLPEKGRGDLQAEIRSALQDVLDDRAAQSGRVVDEELALDVLKDYGSPETVAASYQPERYLIGPRLYPAFLKTVQIVLPVMGALALVGLGVSLGKSPLSPDIIVEKIIRSLVEFGGSLVTALGMVVLVYAVLERTAPNLKEKPAQWDPRSLYKIKPADRVSLGEPITNIIFTLAAMIIFNFFPHLIAITWQAGEGWISVPVLSQTFWGYLPAINLLWAAQVVLNAGLVYRGHWSGWTRWMSLAVHGLEIGLAAAMLGGGSLIGISAAGLAAQSDIPLENAGQLITVLDQAVRVALGVILAFGVVSVVQALLRLVKDRRAPVLIQG